MAARGDNTTPSRADDHDDTPSATRPRAPTRAKFGRRTAAHWRFPYLRNLPPSRPARARAFGSGPACAQPRSVTGEAWTWRCSDPTPATAMPPPPLRARPGPHTQGLAARRGLRRGHLHGRLYVAGVGIDTPAARAGPGHAPMEVGTAAGRWDRLRAAGTRPRSGGARHSGGERAPGP